MSSKIIFLKKCRKKEVSHLKTHGITKRKRQWRQVKPNLSKRLF